MGQSSGCIPERPGTGLVRWSARLVLFLLAAGLLLLLGEGRASAASSEQRSIGVSIETPRVAPARAARKLVVTATRAASRRAARPAPAHRRPAVQQRRVRATASALTSATQPLDPVAGHAGRRVERVVGQAGQSLGQALGGTTRRVDAVLAPVKRTVEPVLGPVTRPVGDVLDGPVRPVDLLPDLTDRPPVPATSPAPARTGGARHSAHESQPVVAWSVLSAGTGGPAGPSAAAERVAIDRAPAGRDPGAGKPAGAAAIPGIPAQTTRDAPTGSLVSAMLLPFLLLLWSVSFGKDGTSHHARPPLLFPA
jgi:hypothetical protein